MFLPSSVCVCVNVVIRSNDYKEGETMAFECVSILPQLVEQQEQEQEQRGGKRSGRLGG
jgi:2-phosphoglycerate kinase